MHQFGKLSFRIPYFHLALLTLCAFLTGGNIAWLNPRPNFKPTYTISEKIPFYWQYLSDSRNEIETASSFPNYVIIVPHATRTNRPLYPTLVFGFGVVAEQIIKPFIDLSKYGLHLIARAAVGYMILKILIFFLTCLALYFIVAKKISSDAALLAVILMLFHKYSLLSICTYHTLELEFINPILILYLFLDITEEYSLNKNILYSLAVGFLMLGKQNYACYLTIIAMGILYKEYAKTTTSFLIHLVPLGLWLLFLYLNNTPYYNNESAVYNQPGWIFTDLLTSPIIEQFSITASYLKRFALSLTNIYPLLFPLSLYAAKDCFSKYTNKREMIFISLYILFIFVQFMASRHYAQGYDISIILFAISSYFIFKLGDRFGWMSKKRIVVLVAFLWIAWNLLQLVHFPWIHPYDQLHAYDKMKISS